MGDVGELVGYVLDGPVATVTMDDGKVNALSPAMFEQLGAAFDRAEADGAAVVLTGRRGRFSGGFDLGVLQQGGAESVDLVRTGFELSVRLLSFPAPVVVACTGHAIAMGAFLFAARVDALQVAGGVVLAAAVVIGVRTETQPNPPHGTIE